MTATALDPGRLARTQLQAWVKSTGRSWWQAGYANGKVINEWDTVPLLGRVPLPGLARLGHTSRWEELPKLGLRALRLVTPFGKGEVWSERDYTLFQFKHGGIDVAVRSGKNTRWCDAHVIGRVINGHGDCELIAAEFGEKPRVTEPIKDNVLSLRYKGIGALALDPLGIRL